MRRKEEAMLSGP